MIEYLEQLERDLVEAVERYEPGLARRPGRRPRPPRWTLALGAVVVIGALIALVGLAARVRDEERAVAPPSPPAPVAVELAGDLVRLDAATWSARVRVRGGTGTLLINAGAQLMARTPRPFAVTTAGGSLAGCVVPAIHRTGDGAVTWDTLAPVSEATGTLRPHRGGYLRITGRTRVAGAGSAGATRAPASAGSPALSLRDRC
jgi:hypothetical protein